MATTTTPAAQDDSLGDVPTETYRLLLGHGARTITVQGEGIEAIAPYNPQAPGAHRRIIFDECKLRGLHGDTIKIAGKELPEINARATVCERLPDDLLWNQPWKIGMLAWRHSTALLYVPPAAFQPFWDTVDAPEHEQLIVDVRGKPFEIPNARGLEVFEVGLHVPCLSHPVVHEIKSMRRRFAKAANWVLTAIGLGFALFAVQTAYWLLHSSHE